MQGIAALISLAMFLGLVFSDCSPMHTATARVTASSPPCHLHPASVTGLPILNQPSGSHLTQMSTLVDWHLQIGAIQGRLPAAGVRHQ